MSREHLTPEQLAAVTARGGSVLVSAAAGSGKTRVLVERLLDRVTDPDDPCDIDRFLIITYTRAAAAEMRARIIGELAQRVAGDPENRHLRRQMTLIYRAEITTVHAFCASLLRENAHLCGLNPDFRVADDAECDLLRKKALDEMLEGKYASIEPESGFGRLAEAVLAGRDDRRLAQVVLETHAKLQSHPDPQKWMKMQLESLDVSGVADAGQTAWGREILSAARGAVLHRKESLLSALSEMRAVEAVYNGYGKSMERDAENAGGLLAALSEGWERTRACLGTVEFLRLGPVRKFEDRAFLDRMKAVRDLWKKTYRDIALQFDASTEELKDDLRAVYPVAAGLFEAVRDFETAYAREKRRRNLCDFGDLEHFALRLLGEEDGDGKTRPSPLAALVRARYREIMVDEYQDVNEVQELILSFLSRDNVFMVGDVKQSIYRFRLADPGIFLEKYRTYPDYDAGLRQKRSKIVLSKNFRSRAQVLGAVNSVFESLMTEEAAEIDYTERERLYCGAEYEGAGEKAEFRVLDLNGGPETGEEETPDKTEAEAAYVASRIKELLDGGMTVSDGMGGKRPASPRDIAVLMRSPGGRTAYYDRALAQAGVPCRVDRGEGLMGTMEVSVALSFLAVIDNPRQDIPLLSVLRSPVFAFGSDELALIRAGHPEGEYFDAVTAAAENGNEKCARFLDALEELRFEAPEMSVDALLWHIYGKTGLLGLFSAMPAGSMRRANLLQLYDYARNYEKTSFKGLFSFVGFVRRMMERGLDLGGAQGAGEDSDAVSIMSIHKSKGLEFPIVFVADCSRQFNRDDLKKPVLLHKSLGAGFKRQDECRRYEYPTVMRRAVELRLKKEMLAEELRVLYVAMTRAGEKLILTCAVPDAGRFVKKISMLASGEKPSPQAVLSAGCLADWLVLALINRPCAAALRAEAFPETPEGDGPGEDGFWDIRVVRPADVPDAGKEYPAGREPEVITNRTDTDKEEKIAEEIKRRLTWRYPHPGAVRSPSKLTATQLKGRFNDYESAEEASGAEKPREFPRPRFSGEDRTLSPAERGTAMHLAMQFIGFERCTDASSVRSELARLLEMRLLTPEQAGAVETGKVLSFFSSALGKRALASANLMREFKFSVLAPAGRFAGLVDEPGEEVLLQGVIDCCFEENGGWVVLDFKTDRVNAENEIPRAGEYEAQLGTYAWALESVTGKPVAERYVYFFSTGHAIRV